ncbi:MAG TPA: terminase small subunit [Candidatus Gastranaerophilales bacterium]|nr:terminase small subunit [Candidatus Gastranaerophilales bacterium]
MPRKMNAMQIEFCKYYLESCDACEPNAYNAALKAGYSQSVAKTYPYKWLQRQDYKDYINLLKAKHQQENEYTIEKYLDELDHVQKQALSDGNVSLTLRILQAKAKVYGFDKLTMKDKKDYQQFTPKIDVFEKIEEKAHVFEKIRHTNA